MYTPTEDPTAGHDEFYAKSEEAYYANHRRSSLAARCEMDAIDVPSAEDVDHAKFINRVIVPAAVGVIVAIMIALGAVIVGGLAWVAEKIWSLV